MSRLTRDGTAEPVSRDQILRHERGQGNIHFPCSADHEQDWQLYSVDPYSCYMYVWLYIHTYYHGVKLAAKVTKTPQYAIFISHISTCARHTNSGCGKERRILFGLWWPAKAALVRNYPEVYWPCASGLLAVNANCTLMCDPINSGLTRWRMAGGLNK